MLGAVMQLIVNDVASLVEINSQTLPPLERKQKSTKVSSTKFQKPPILFFNNLVWRTSTCIFSELFDSILLAISISGRLGGRIKSLDVGHQNVTIIVCLFSLSSISTINLYILQLVITCKNGIIVYSISRHHFFYHSDIFMSLKYVFRHN